MSISMVGINFDYLQAIQQAQQLENAAQELRSLADRELKSGIDGIAESWSGEAANQFLAYCSSLQKDIYDEASRIMDTAKRIREVARVIRDAEEKAKETLANNTIRQS